MNKLFSLCLIALLIAVSNEGYSQKEIEQRQMTWFGYFNQTRFTNKSGLWFDAHLRLNGDFTRQVHTTMLRAAYTYYFSDNARLSVGYANVFNPGHEGADDVKEHRPWQQIQWFEKKSWFNMAQYIRLEQRYRKVGDGGDYTFNSHRVRYNISFTIPLTQKQVAPKTPFLFTNNELFINMGKNIVNNYFDQNRFFVGLGYQFTSHMNAQVGYLNVFQQLPASNKYVNTDAIRLFVFHNLDLRNNDEGKK
jgi:hypothetical protein